MKKYIVTIKEVHAQEIIVEAASPAHAQSKARDGDGDYGNGSTYEYLLDEDAWEVREA